MFNIPDSPQRAGQEKGNEWLGESTCHRYFESTVHERHFAHVNGHKKKNMGLVENVADPLGKSTSASLEQRESRNNRCLLNSQAVMAVKAVGVQSTRCLQNE